MAPEELMAVLRQRPFEPFRLQLTNGQHYDIRHPDQCMPTRRAVFIGLPANPEQTVPDTPVRVDPLHIVSVEPLETPTRPQDNGQQGAPSGE